MRETISDITATVGIALMLGGVNEYNPYQFQCIAGAIVLVLISYKIGGYK